MDVGVGESSAVGGWLGLRLVAGLRPAEGLRLGLALDFGGGVRCRGRRRRERGGGRGDRWG